MQHVAQAAMGIGEFRRQGHSTAARRDGGRYIALQIEGNREAMMRSSDVRLEGDGLPQAGDCVLDTVVPEQEHAKALVQRSVPIP